MLRVENVSSGYGAIGVLQNISLHVKFGEMVTLIGANGAGKTTILNTISGLIPCKQGNIGFAGQDITRTSPDKIARMGLIQVQQDRQLFGPLTVYENLILGTYSQYWSLRRQGREGLLQQVFKLFPVLSTRKNQVAHTLSGGEQQMLAIGRTMMAQPKLLLLDEPFSGLAPILIHSIVSVLKWLNGEQRIPIFLVEQRASVALKLATRGYVIRTGQVILEGDTIELLRNERVKDIYLGEKQ